MHYNSLPSLGNVSYQSSLKLLFTGQMVERLVQTFKNLKSRLSNYPWSRGRRRESWEERKERWKEGKKEEKNKGGNGVGKEGRIFSDLIHSFL